MTTRTDSDSATLVGQLRRSIHELNNALTPILANAQLAQVMTDPSSADVREALDDVVEAAGRANQLVAELRDIATGLQEPGAPTAEARDG